MLMMPRVLVGWDWKLCSIIVLCTSDTQSLCHCSPLWHIHIHWTILLLSGRCKYLEENSRRTRQGYRDAERPATGKPPRVKEGPVRRPRAANGGAKRHWNDSRRRHPERSAGKSGRGWGAAAADDVQVGSASHRERRWGTGENWEVFK